MLARGLGRVNYFTEPEAKALLDLKQQWGFHDPRAEMKNCDICANDVFRESWKQTGVRQEAFQPPHYGGSAPANGSPAGAKMTQAEHEALIQSITDRVMEALQGK